jgi:hypothetical protein
LQGLGSCPSWPASQPRRAQRLAEHHNPSWIYCGKARASPGTTGVIWLRFLHRAGFDAFEVTKDKDAAVFVEALQRYSVFYQPTGDGRPSTLKVRLAQRRPATVRDRREVVR